MMMKTVSIVTAAVVLFAFSNLFAQGEAPAPASPAPPPAPTSTMDGEKKSKKHEDGNGHKEKGHGKGGDKSRGLDRADEAAGEHGAQGRDNARDRGKHGKD